MNAWILAGGLSSRFGSDKAVYPVEGVLLAIRIATVLREAGLMPRLVARHARGLGLPELIEPEGPRHPLHGVATALAWEARQDPAAPLAFFTPCDLVDLDVAQVRALQRGGPIVALGQPLLGILPVDWADRAAAWATSGRSVHSFVNDVPVVDLGLVHNLNRPGCDLSR